MFILLISGVMAANKKKAGNTQIIMSSDLSDSEDGNDANRRAIQEAVDNALKISTSNVSGKIGVSTRTSRSSNEDVVGNVVKQVLVELIPTISTLISSAVQAATEPIISKLNELSSGELYSEPSHKLKSVVQHQKLDIDRLEQYSRRDSIRISGLPEEQNENTNEKIVKIAKDLGLQIQLSDISVSHRLGKPNRAGRNGNAPTPRPVIAKFVRRDIKTQMCMKKKNLKNIQGCDGIYIDEDLTPLRYRIVRELRKEPGRFVWTIDGKIHTKITKDGKDIKTVLETVDDFLEFGWTEEKLRDIGLAVEL